MDHLKEQIMFVHALGSASLGSSGEIRRSIDLMRAEAALGRTIIVTAPFRGVAGLLAKAAEAALEESEPYEPLLRSIEERHFEVVHEGMHIRRQSSVIAGIRHQINQLEDVLGGVALLHELSPRTRDMISSWGGRLAGYVFSECLRELRPDVRLMDARDLILTDDRFTRARIIIEESRSRIARAFAGAAFTAVVPGGCGATAAGEIATLGRAGNKLTASTLASALEARELVIWTDTDGLLTADPAKVPSARPIQRMNYIEAMEMMHFGGDFLYPPSLIPAMRKGITIRVRNVNNPSFEGTLLTARCAEDRLFTGISSMNDIALLQIQGSGMVGVTGTAMRLFTALAEAGVNVILISQASSEHSICVGILSSDAEKAKRAVTEAFRGDLEDGLIDEISVEDGHSILAVVSERMRHTPGLAAMIFGTLGEAKVNVKAAAQGSSELNVSFVIDGADAQRALLALHRTLIENERRSV
jgi:aspartokinase/homoserine dehydrogenase 1